jgi:hypothetical protein
VTAATRTPLRDQTTKKGHSKSRVCREMVPVRATETGEVFGDNKLGRKCGKVIVCKRVCEIVRAAAMKLLHDEKRSKMSGKKIG